MLYIFSNTAYIYHIQPLPFLCHVLYLIWLNQTQTNLLWNILSLAAAKSSQYRRLSTLAIVEIGTLKDCGNPVSYSKHPFVSLLFVVKFCIQSFYKHNIIKLTLSTLFTYVSFANNLTVPHRFPQTSPKEHFKTFASIINNSFNDTFCIHTIRNYCIKSC